MTPLLGFAAFRESIEDGLSDKSVVGEVNILNNGVADIANKAENESESVAYKSDPLEPASGYKGDFRVCDFYAYRLSGLEGFPDCEPYWPEAKRDEAVAACRAFLQQHGDDYQWSAADSGRRE
jgi:hypothetical protein